MRYSFLVVAVAGCAYQPGSFAFPQSKFASQRATVGCLDISVERRPDLSSGPVLGYQFANRCDRPTTVDLGAVVVVGRTTQGLDVTLRPYDPRRELHPVALDGRTVGAESLAYPVARTMSQVCVDVAPLVHQAAAQWLCLGNTAGTVVGSVP
jgi:hypothetical protein